MDKKKTNEKGKEKIVILDGGAKEQFDGLPEDVKKELTEIFDKMASGEINPEEIGETVSFRLMDIQLECPKCRSEEVQWRDFGEGEVGFRCECGENGCVDFKEYVQMIKEYPGCIIEDYDYEEKVWKVGFDNG